MIKVSMKKLFSIFIIIALAVSVSFAQNTATANQNGDFNNATITQTGSNNALVEQNSYADDPAKGNTVNVTQTLVGALKNTATVYQGDIAAGKVTRKSIATVNQLGENNDAQIYMHTTRSGQNDESTIMQNGKDNQAISYLRSHQSQFEFTYVRQNGYDNYAYQDKDDEREGSLIIKQTSTVEDMGNEAYQYTHKDQARNLYIEQIGAKNFAKQDIYKGSWSTVVQYGDYNEAKVYTPNNQKNKSTILQGDVVASLVDKNTDAVLNATSSYNTARLTQKDGDNEAVIVQKGVGNHTVELEQTVDSTADILQDGDGNMVMGIGADVLAKSYNGSTLDVDQLGDGNTLHLQQDNASTATVFQNGNSNISTVIQN